MKKILRIIAMLLIVASIVSASCCAGKILKTVYGTNGSSDQAIPQTSIALESVNKPAGAGGIAADANVAQKVSVELDIFSGRPNPAWELSSGEILELARNMAGLTPTSKPAVANGLGYRGFVISNPGNVAKLPVKIYVFSGVLAVTDKGPTSYYNDVNNIESWLINKAEEHGYGDIISEAKKRK